MKINRKYKLNVWAGLLAVLCVIITFYGCKEDLPEEGSLGDDTPPEADFSYEPDGSDYQLINFTNLSISAISYVWDFGDGDTTSVEHPSHKYSADGTYTVSLLAMDGKGDTDTTSMDVVIMMNTVPEAGFTYEAQAGDFKTINFTNNSKNATKYLWDFGDGNKSVEITPSHTYASEGTYTVWLFAEDADEDKDSISHVVVVTDPLGPPVAAYSYEADAGNYQLIHFTNASANADSYEWDFGDGGSSTDESPSYTFTVDGTYDVRLIAINASTKDTLTQSIEIKDRVLITPEIANPSFSKDLVDKNANRDEWRNTALETSADALFGNGTWVIQMSSSDNTGDGGWCGALPFGADPLVSRRWAYQVVTVQDNVDYTLNFFVRQDAGNTLYVDIYDGAFDDASVIDDASRIVASETFDDASGHSTGSYVAASFNFNSGDNTEIVIFITNDYAGGNNTSRFDDFELIVNQ
ncbi:PKD domain-containing protein [Marinoscillum sp. MHG1-6]|uniref:PKD domain-containing protein n=1 Tax=Marinoscillum sp. MHG1-6 TaxID=2959627 RepID=UPI002157F432|nr:PKD domain-containing protein [Marinoscillum sp. MHG1-6]